jgi:hypothetical protein
MASSSVIHSGEQPPVVDKGHGVDALGPSDSSDTGSDVRGQPIFPEGDMGDIDPDTDAGGTGERAGATFEDNTREGKDIGVDRIVSASEIGATDSPAPWADPETGGANEGHETLSNRQQIQESAEDAAVQEEEQTS